MKTATTLEQTHATPALPTGGADRIDAAAFDIGWDHARHGLAPPAELLLHGGAMGQGWLAARAVFGKPSLPTPQARRRWLALRLQAWREGVAFDTRHLTPQHLARLQVSHCPVLRRALGGAAEQPDAAVFVRLDPLAAYTAGNLVMVSRAAAQARSGVDLQATLRRARIAQRSGELVAGLDAGAWWRLAALQACVTRLPFHEAARLPLAALPPHGVRPRNAAQGLQTLVTLLFTAPGWSGRTRALAALLPQDTLRHDFNLFVGAVAARVLEAGPDPARQRLALEDAWLQERVQRRWQHFLLSLGEDATSALLALASDPQLDTARSVKPAPAQTAYGRATARAAWRPPVTAVTAVTAVTPVTPGHRAALCVPAPTAAARPPAC